MNIDDVTDQVEIPGNPVIRIFALQRVLQSKYHHIEVANGINYPLAPWNIDDSAVQYILKDIFWRTTEELCEAMEVIPSDSDFANWKARWGVNSDLRHFFEELADALHFLVEASIIAEMNENEIEIAICPILDEPVVFNCNDDFDARLLVAEVIFSLGLAANTLKNKPWKQTQMPTDKDRFQAKLLTAWQDFATMWNEMGFSLADIFILYTRKHTVNTWRQETNY